MDMSGDSVGYGESVWIPFVLLGVLPIHYGFLNDGVRRRIQRLWRYLLHLPVACCLIHVSCT